MLVFNKGQRCNQSLIANLDFRFLKIYGMRFLPEAFDRSQNIKVTYFLNESTSGADASVEALKHAWSYYMLLLDRSSY